LLPVSQRGARIRKRKRFPRDLPVTIESLSDKGLGCVELDQEHGTRTLNVKAALPGEQLIVDVLNKRRGQWYANPKSVKLASEHRINAPCKNFIACGGCTLQHVSQDFQLELKNRNLIRKLDTHNVHFESNLPPVSGPKYLYRRRARLGVKYVAAKQRVLVGFREGFGGKIVDMSECLVLSEPFASQLKNIQILIAGLSNCDKIPQIELAAGDHDAVIILRHLTEFEIQDYELIEAFHRFTGLQVYSQAGGYESVKLLYGSFRNGKNLSYAIPDYGVTIFHAVSDFVQVNNACNLRLINAAVSGLRLCADDQVLELFCGVGNFSLPMARTAGCVLGLEGDEDLVASARQNAQYNGLSGKAQFEKRDLYSTTLDPKEIARGFCLYNKMLVDPPRSGIGTAMRLIESSSVERLAYISCNPETFAMDAASLCDLGFQLESVRVFDMFPQTTHVETLGLFQRSMANRAG